jgi:molybdenum cofactor synthesis domain-containing protein
VSKTAALLIVGDEVLSGEVRDENGPWLIGRLSALGTRVARVSTVPDRMDEIIGELRALRAFADVVLTSGGIGPTHDDLTRQAVAEALGLPLVRHVEAVAKVRRWYGDKTTAAELTMADLPDGARVLRGARTDTLGFSVAGVYVLPGVPFLLRDLVDGAAAEFAGPPLHREEVRTDLREGEVAPDLARIQAASLDVAIGSYPIADGPHWWTKVMVRGADASRVASVASDVRAAFARLAGAS